MIEFSISGSRI